MTEENSYTSKQKTFIIQKPLAWGHIRDLLKERFDIEETEGGKVIVENKEEKKSLELKKNET